SSRCPLFSIVFQGVPDSLHAEAYSHCGLDQQFAASACRCGCRVEPGRTAPLSRPRQTPLHRNIFPLQSKKNDRTFSSNPGASSMTADYKVHGDVAVITMNNPPVNGLGHATRLGLTNGLE